MSPASGYLSPTYVVSGRPLGNARAIQRQSGPTLSICNTFVHLLFLLFTLFCFVSRSGIRFEFDFVSYVLITLNECYTRLLYFKTEILAIVMDREDIFYDD